MRPYLTPLAVALLLVFCLLCSGAQSADCCAAHGAGGLACVECMPDNPLVGHRATDAVGHRPVGTLCVAAYGDPLIHSDGYPAGVFRPPTFAV